jgi:peptide/nickel transport system substrate-binding protein
MVRPAGSSGNDIGEVLMARRRRAGGLAGLVGAILCLTVTVTACVPAVGTDRTGTAGGLGSARARGDNGDGSYRAPRVPPGPAVFVAHEAPFLAYNNKTAQTNNNPGNAVVLSQVLADPFIVDGSGNFLLNSDVLVSAALTSTDPQVVTYRIKPSVKWSDGQPWTCRDFYLAWLAGSGQVPYFKPATTRGLDRVTAECRDDHTFVETYRSPYADWRRNYIEQAILPAHVLERETGIPDVTALTPTSPAAALKKAAKFWNDGWNGFNDKTMPASGPYQFDSSTSSGRVVLVRNRNWPGSPAGPAMLVITSVPDAAAMVQGLLDRQLNVVQPTADPLLAERLRALSTRGVVFAVRGGPSVEQLDLNLTASLFKDPVVRTAFAQCVDRNQLVDELVRGVRPDAQPLGSLAFLPEDPAYQDLYSDTMVADPRKAQVTLERAGWILGPDGVYSRGGQRLSFALSHDGSPAHAREVELIRKQCRQAGMEITDGANRGGFQAALAGGHFDVALLTSSHTWRVWSLAEHYSSQGVLNYQHYRNPGVDAAVRIAQTEYAAATQLEALAKADRLLAEDLVSLPLFQLPIMWAYTGNVDRVYRHDVTGVTWNANEWIVR